ncbi:haloacid dehalogenase-like hydrolase domain-containing protein 2 [Folsomia candida]|nr:haloacid dehalogenase-like hydrolase domain-containing protein 2 [Folsomia candida]
MFMNKHELKHPFLLVSDDVLKDFNEMETLNPFQYDSIVLGLPSTMVDYRLMTKALSILHNGHPLLVLHPARTEKAKGSCQIIAPGLYAKTLEFATDAKLVIPSKPSVGFYVEACKYVGFPPEQCVMIGDCISDDVRNPHEICMKAILVKTGKYKNQDEFKYCQVRPELVVDNFYKAIRYVLSATDTDPDKASDLSAEAAKREQWKKEHDDFFLRLSSYANDDKCVKSRSICPQKIGSFIW